MRLGGKKTKDGGMNGQAEINIVYCSDENYMMPTLVSAASAAVYSRDESPMVIHLIDSGVKDATYADFERRLTLIHSSVRVRRHKWVSKNFDAYPSWHGSRVIYARLTIQDMLPDVDWAISLDGDTLWFGNPRNLMALRDESLLFLASEDQTSDDGVELAPVKWFRSNKLNVDPSESFCAGLMLLNLKRLREFDFTNKATAFLLKYKNPPCPEQMVMSYLCLGHAKALPREWGVFSIYHNRVDLSKGGVVHYVSDAPWRRNARNKLLTDIILLWYDCARVVLGIDLRARYMSRVVWSMKRILFLLLKSTPVSLRDRYLRQRVRNIEGLSSAIRKLVTDRWMKAREVPNA